MVTRKELREIEGIRFSWVCEPIPANDSILITFDKTRLQKYAPFDVVTIYNNSSNQITAYINQNPDLRYPVAAKSEREIDKIWCHSLLLQNDGITDIAAGDIVIFFERKGITADEAAKRQARWWLW
jgi:hypothetical protein